MEMDEIALELNNEYLILLSKTALLWVYVCELQGDLGEPLASQNIKDAIALNDSMMIPQNLHFYADCALMRKGFKEAETRYSVGMRTALENGNQVEACIELTGLLFAVSGQGRYMKALRLMGAVDAKHDELGYAVPLILFWKDWFEEYIVNGARKAVGEEKAAQYEQEGRLMGFEKAVDYALDFEKD
jgi:hypothetical protein